MTQTTRWSAGTAVAVLLILVAGWFLLISPQRTEAQDLEAQAAGTEADNLRLESEIATLKAQQKQLPKWQAQLAELQTQIPSSPAMPSLIRSLSDIAKSSGVSLDSMSPAAPVLTPGSLSAQELQLTVSGGYFEIQRFVNNLERLERVFLVTGLGLAEAADETDTTTSSSDSAELTGTVSGRVFLVPPGQAAEATTSGTDTSTDTTTGTAPASQ